jgi:hypothetical protein
MAKRKSAAKAEEQPSLQDNTALYLTLKEQVQADIDHSNAWRVRSKGEFGFVVDNEKQGQWASEDKAKLASEGRPPVVFNKTLKFIRAVGGIEVNNRQQTTYIASDPTEPGEVKANEMATQGSEWMDSKTRASRKKSRCFRDLLICGMGWGESVMDFDDDPRGEYVLERINPLEMGWDYSARDQNLMDAKRRWRCREMLLSEARALMAGITEEEFHDDDLDASWCDGIGVPQSDIAKTREEKEKREENTTGPQTRRTVHLVQIQWWEYEFYHRVMNPASMTDPNAQPHLDLTPAQIKEMEKAGQLPGELPRSRRLRRKVFKQAWLGGKVLHVGPAPRPDGFTLHCMTGEPDDLEGTWFGLVKLARDPQNWENKFFVQIMHIINSTAKGGIIIEDDAVEDIREFLGSYAKPNAVSVVRSGAVSKGKVMAKPGAGLTAGVLQLYQMAQEALPDVLGINLELMGLQDRDQAGVLEAQRKQSAMTILATLFDSLSLWEEERGHAKLYFLREYMADGRLIRITGEDGMQAIPLLKDSLFGKFDVVVDEAPASMHMKEKAWQGLQFILPVMQEQGALNAETGAMILDFVPYLPTKLVEGLKASLRKPNPMAEEGAKTQLEGEKAKVKKDNTAAVLNLASAAAAQAKADATRRDGVRKDIETVLQEKDRRHKRTTDMIAANADEQVMGQTGGRQLPQLPDLNTGQVALPQMDVPQIAAPGGLEMPAGLNGGM